MLPENYLLYGLPKSVVPEQTPKESPKSFWKRYEFLIIVIATLLLIYGFVVFNQKINFLLGNELIVYLAPQQKSFDMHYGETSKVAFDVSIDNAAYCRASCSYAFSDMSISEIVDKGGFDIQKGRHFTKSYDLSVKRLGSGQDIYSFEAKCHSIKSFLCFTKSPEKYKTSLITVNYDLTETEKELKKILKKNVTELLMILSGIDVLHQQTNQKYFELAHKVNLNNLSKEKISIDDAYDKTRISIENLRSIWAVEDYVKLSRMFNESYFMVLRDVENSIKNLDWEIDSAVNLHNGLLLKLKTLNENLNDLGSYANILDDNETLNNSSVIMDKFNGISSSMANNTFESYAAIVDEIGDITKQQNSLTEKTRIPAAELFFKTEYYLKFENDLLCSLRQDCSKNISAAGMIENSGNFIEKYPNSAYLRQNCDSLKELNQMHPIIRNETSALIETSNTSFPSDERFLQAAADFRDNLVRSVNNSYFGSFEKIRLENKTSPDIVKIAEYALPKNLTEIELIAYNESVNLSLHLLSKINLSRDALEILDKCQKLGPEKTGYFDFKPVSLNISYNITSKIDTNLSDNPPICCIFGECRPCCRDESCKNNPKTFPVIFLHGHSFAKDNSPEFSLDSFNKLQAKLQDDGYLNAGIVSLYSKNEQLQQGIWGLSGKPVTVKASYYYDAFRKDDKYIMVPTKSENIDTYALRLKDLIEIVKERTNKPKVSIIAHSMGGLVARRYIQIFGDDDVDKLIMISAPNNGISGAIGDYCGFVGENRECVDMQENSLFINKLNDNSKQPKKTRLYSVIGRGCSMKLGDGDGIVLSENAKLENAELHFVNGTCPLFGSTLHTEILDTEKYPETYRIITDILSG